MKQFLTTIPRVSKQQVQWLLIGLALGIVLFGLVRFVFLPTQEVHYHANFAVFINGERQQFNGPQYYQEIASCTTHDTPQSRVHMHDNVSHIVHVHDKLVTWGNLFTVLGWSLHEKSLFDGTHVYTDGQESHLRFMLNGRPVLSIANEVIQSEDRLLVSFGSADQKTLEQQYAQIESDAGEFNRKLDPASCRGLQQADVWNRLRAAFWLP
jgi:hypothetical protein